MAAPEDTTAVTAVTRIYTGGNGAPWQPGSPVPLPASHAAIMQDAGHAEPGEPAAPAVEAPAEPTPEPAPEAEAPHE